MAKRFAHVSLPDDILKALDTLAAEADRTRSAQITHMVRMWPELSKRPQAKPDKQPVGRPHVSKPKLVDPPEPWSKESTWAVSVTGELFKLTRIQCDDPETGFVSTMVYVPYDALPYGPDEWDVGPTEEAKQLLAVKPWDAIKRFDPVMNQLMMKWRNGVGGTRFFADEQEAARWAVDGDHDHD